MEDFVCYEIDFGVGLLCKEEVLGCGFDISIHDIFAKIKFPRLHPLLTHKTYSAHKDLIAPASIPDRYERLRIWGKVLSVDPKDERRIKF